MDVDVMASQIYARLDAMAADPVTGEKLNTIHIDPGAITPPVAMLTYPDEIDPHGTYNRGMPRVKTQLIIAVGRPGEQSTPDRVALWCKDSGPTSVLEWLEAQGWSHPEFSDLTVTLIRHGPVEVNTVPYAAVFFDLDIA